MSQEEEEDNEDEYQGTYNQEFEINAILDKRAHPKNGKIEYLVQWKKWPLDPTWEPKNNVKKFLEQNELFVEDEVLRNHYIQKQYRRKVLREERHDQIQRMCSDKQALNETNIDDIDIDHIGAKVEVLKRKYSENSYNPDKETQMEEEEEIFYNSQDDSHSNDNVLYEQNTINQKSNQMTKQEYSNKQPLHIEYPLLKKCLNSYSPILPKEVTSSYSFNQNQMQTNCYENSLNEKNSHLQQQKKQQYKIFNKMKFNTILFEKEEDEDDEKNKFLENSSSSTEKINPYQSNQIVKKLKIINQPSCVRQEFSQSNETNQVGNFLTDDILNIEFEVKYSFKVNWHQRKNGIIPESKYVQFLKKKNISPQQMLDKMIEASCRQNEQEKEFYL